MNRKHSLAPAVRNPAMRTDRRSCAFGAALAAALFTAAVPVHAQQRTAMPQLVDLCTPPAGGAIADTGLPATTPYRPEGDWAWLCYYRSENEAAREVPAPDIVFMGDSITRNWITIDPTFFGPARLGRGISGQTSAQMVLRFNQDAVALRPKAIHLLVGTNDVAGNVGAMGIEAYKANITAMGDMAKANGIALILGTIPPADRFPWRTSVAPVADIRALNQWLRDFAKARGLAFIDYHAALAAPSGAAREGLTRDGVHPNGDGYQIMADLARPVLAKAVARAKRGRGR